EISANGPTDLADLRGILRADLLVVDPARLGHRRLASAARRSSDEVRLCRLIRMCLAMGLVRICRTVGALRNRNSFPNLPDLLTPPEFASPLHTAQTV